MVLNVPEMIPNGTTMQKGYDAWCLFTTPIYTSMNWEFPIRQTGIWGHCPMGFQHWSLLYIADVGNGKGFSRSRLLNPQMLLRSVLIDSIWFIFCCTALIMIMDDPGKEKTIVWLTGEIIYILSVFGDNILAIHISATLILLGCSSQHSHLSESSMAWYVRIWVSFWDGKMEMSSFWYSIIADDWRLIGIPWKYVLFINTWYINTYLCLAILIITQL